MAILNYLKANKDITFEEKPLNILDIALITELSYFNYECFLPLPDEMIKLDYFKDDLKTLVDPSLFVRKNATLFKEITTSKRFKDLLFGEFSFEVSDEGRYCSMLVQCAGVNFILYRGTDLTIAGWVEDFNMVVFETIISQRLGVEYTRRIMDKYDGNFILAGHSKGGNIAIYSAYAIEDSYLERINGIYDFDGPGFKDDITKHEKYQRIYDKIQRFIPQNDMVGACLNASEPNIVRSTSVSIFQHDMYTWNTKGDDFYYLKNKQFKSKCFGSSISAWLDSMSYDEKVQMIDIIYGIFKKAEIDSVNQLKMNLLLSVNSIMKAYFKEDKEKRRFINKFLFAFTKLYIKYNLGFIKINDSNIKKPEKEKVENSFENEQEVC